MGKFDGILICSDIDGTLARQGKISPRNLEKISYFQSEGGIFTLATGRYAGYSSDLAVRANGPIITENGARIYDDALGRTLWTFPLDGAGPLLEWLDANPSPCYRLRYVDGFEILQAGSVVEHVLSHKAGDLLQIICSDFDSEEQAIAFRDLARARFGSRFVFHRSWETGVEIVSPLGGKGNCLRQLRQILGGRAKTVLAIGDYENDISMFRTADHSFAPSNACGEARAAAETVLCSCEEGAVGSLIEWVETRLSEGGAP